MNKNLIIFGITAVLVCVGLSGCFKNNSNNDSSGNDNGSNANSIITEWQHETDWDSIKGDYITITLTLKNNGTDNATYISVSLYSTNQYNLLEANKTAIVPVNLAPNETRDVYFIFDYEPETFSLNNKITIRWKGGSNKYSKVIDL